MHAVEVTLVVFAKLLLAVVLGGAVGWQRETYDKPAGFRTHVLVCVGATIYCLISLAFSVDPGRVAAGVATGMGFLGAGTIIRAGHTVRGLTTAASLWAVAAIGLAVGLAAPELRPVDATALTATAVLGTVVVLLALSGLGSLERGLIEKHGTRRLEVQMGEGSREAVPAIYAALIERKVQVDRLDLSDAESGHLIRFDLDIPPDADTVGLTQALSTLPEVREVRWR